MHDALVRLIGAWPHQYEHRHVAVGVEREVSAYADAQNVAV